VAAAVAVSVGMGVKVGEGWLGVGMMGVYVAAAVSVGDG
jgi:hypothetical protein